MSGNVTSTTTSIARKFNIAFNSPELGAFSFTENDSILPFFSWNEKGPILLSKKTITSFTVMNSPASYTLDFNLRDFGPIFLSKKLMPGANTIKFYPDEMQTLAYFNNVYLETVFSQSKKIVINGKKYQYSRRFFKNYGVKIVD